jgi:hypothetical protein
MPSTELYIFRAADGVDYEATVDQLRDWLGSGRVRNDDTVTNFLNGQTYKISEALSIGLPGPAIPQKFADYPRGQAIGSLPIEMTGKFNWGAFVFTWIWGLNHKKYILLIALVPCLGLPVAIWAGISGNQWAWDSGRFQRGAECKKCQDIWRNWGVGFLILYALLILISRILKG